MSSYEREPIIDNLSQGTATPKLLESETTPTTIAIAGAIVNNAEEIIVFLMIALSIFF